MTMIRINVPQSARDGDSITLLCLPEDQQACVREVEAPVPDVLEFTIEVFE